MKCDDVRGRLTAYLDGEVEGDRGSAIRGHLRECTGCQDAATAEASLRDGLRQLPPIDPPASLWAGVQAQLAAAEVADAKKPAWKRALARWAPPLPHLALGGLAAAAAITAVWWRSHRVDDVSPPPREVATMPAPTVKKETALPPAAETPRDVTEDLASEDARVTESYGDAAEELLALANDVRGQWSPERTDAFDARVAELRGAITAAPDDRTRQKGWRALIRYMQGAVVRDEITLAGGGL